MIQEQTLWNKQVGIDLEDRAQLKEVQTIYEETTNNGHFEVTKDDGVIRQCEHGFARRV